MTNVALDYIRINSGAKSVNPLISGNFIRFTRSRGRHPIAAVLGHQVASHKQHDVHQPPYAHAAEREQLADYNRIMNNNDNCFNQRRD